MISHGNKRINAGILSAKARGKQRIMADTENENDEEEEETLSSKDSETKED